VLTGEQVKVGRSRARLTQEQAAEKAGVTLKTWGNWERRDVLTTTIEARVREVLGRQLDVAETASRSPLDSVSDALLLAEIARRFDRGKQASNDPPTSHAGESPATRGHSESEHYLSQLEDPNMQAALEEVAKELTEKRHKGQPNG
jgi:DNA-binding XRE family transcriptional regulator